MTTTAGIPALSALPAAAQAPLAALRDALERTQGDNLAALLVYGSAVRGGWDPRTSDIDIVVVLKDTGPDHLTALAPAMLEARYKARVEGMILKLDNIAAAADVFPLLYDDIRSKHAVVAGVDPFAALEISDHNRRLRIEQELREARIRMRRAIVDAMGVDDAIAGALDRKVKQVRSPLHALLCLKGLACDDRLETVMSEAGRAYGLDTAPLLRVAADPRAAHAAFRALMDASIADADRIEMAGRA